MIVFDCNNISTNKTSILIISEVLSIISSNVLVYLVVIIPTAALGFMPILPIVKLTVVDIVIVIMWVIIVYYIISHISPSKDILLISNNKSIDEILHKFSERKDLYNIKEKIAFDNNFDYIYKKCENYDDVLIGDLTSESRNDIIKYCFNNSKNVFLIPKLSDILIKYSDDIFVFDAPIYYSSNFALSFESMLIKRILDVFISIFVILIFLPIWLIVAVLIKLEDGGPIFFIQERITINCKTFYIIKFRSMKCSNSNEVIPTTDNDDRITNIGRFIRAFHIDEIPQFINVLLGDMSIVGPRPERIEHVNLYSKEIPEFIYRYKVKAGITGLAQIYGKYNTSAINKLKFDLIYIKKYSIILDFELIFKTLRVIFLKENTEGFDDKSKEFIKNNAKK